MKNVLRCLILNIALKDKIVEENLYKPLFAKLWYKSKVMNKILPDCENTIGKPLTGKSELEYLT